MKIDRHVRLLCIGTSWQPLDYLEFQLKNVRSHAAESCCNACLHASESRVCTCFDGRNSLATWIAFQLHHHDLPLSIPTTDRLKLTSTPLEYRQPRPLTYTKHGRRKHTKLRKWPLKSSVCVRRSWVGTISNTHIRTIGNLTYLQQTQRSCSATLHQPHQLLCSPPPASQLCSAPQPAATTATWTSLSSDLVPASLQP